MLDKQELAIEDFTRDVIDKSHKLPVLVDFWAAWCGPCKFLGPIVDKLAAEAEGKWHLVKVNTEDNPDIANEWGIKGIPNLKLFYKGEVIDEVSGAMPEHDLRQWLGDKLPSKAKTLTMEGAKLLEMGEVDAGIVKLEQALVEDKLFEEAKLLLAAQKIWSTPAAVAGLLEGVSYLEKAREILLLAEVLSSDEEEFEEGITKMVVLQGLEALKEKEYAMAIEKFVEAIVKDKSYQNELARRLVIALFHYLGEGNAITRKYRRQFDMAIY